VLLPLEQRDRVTLVGEEGGGETPGRTSADHDDVAGCWDCVHAKANRKGLSRGLGLARARELLHDQVPQRPRCLKILQQHFVGLHRDCELLFDEGDELEDTVPSRLIPCWTKYDPSASKICSSEYVIDSLEALPDTPPSNFS